MGNQKVRLYTRRMVVAYRAAKEAERLELLEEERAFWRRDRRRAQRVDQALRGCEDL